MSATRFLVSRAAQYLAMWFVAISIDFLATRLAPIIPVRSAGPPRPLYEQYLYFLWGLLHLNLGVSLWLYGTPVLDLVLKALQYDVILLVPAILISWHLGNKLGAYLAMFKAGSRTEMAVVPILYALSSVPYFWLAMLFVEVFSSELRLFPSSGVIYSALPSFTKYYILDFLRHLALPLMTLVTAMTGTWALSMRENIIAELRSGYVTYEESLGLSKSILWRHIYDNSKQPQLVNLALSLGLIASGNLVLEAVVGYPGVGVLLYNAITNYDYMLLEGIYFFIISFILIFNFMVDVILVVIDPRIRYSAGLG
ncbi:MAG: ABC transporter permease [Thermoproteus sp.]